MDRETLAGASRGAKNATGWNEIERFKNWMKGKLGGLGGGSPQQSNSGYQEYEEAPDLKKNISNLRSEVTDPEGWNGDLYDLSDYDLGLVYKAKTGKRPGDRYKMLSDLMTMGYE